MDLKREKNPLFLPALIATLIPTVIFAVIMLGGYLPNGVLNIVLPVVSLLHPLMYIGPFVAIILSIAGLYYARQLQEPFIGCLLCLIMSLLLLFSFFWLPMYLYNHHTHTEPSIVAHSQSPEEIESIREEINRALYGDNITKTSK